MAEMVKNWRDDRRNAILDVAHRSFLENGYAATSMSAIATKLGGSKTTLYHYFPSKDALFIAVAREECAKFMDRLYSNHDYSGDTRTILEDFCTRFMGETFQPDAVEFLRMVVAQSPQFPELGRAFFRECIEQGVVHAEKFIGRMMADGRLKAEDPRRCARFLLSLCSGVYTLGRLLCPDDPLGDGIDIRTHAMDIVGLFLRLYGAESAGAKP